MKKYQSFKEFYPFYLSQHENSICKILHFVGSLFVFFAFAYVLVSKKYLFLFLCPLIGYGFAWIGHFIFEKNRPATFTYPFYSLMGDWVMFKDILIGRVKISSAK